MSDTIFRSGVTPNQSQPVEQAPKGDGMQPVLESSIEHPFTDYEKQTGKPFILEHYDLGHLTNRGDIYDSSIFKSEVDNINAYLNHQIEKGEINNTTESVKAEIKRIEKMVNVKPDARSSMRLSLVAEYVNFLLKADGIKRASAKFGLG